MRRMNSMLSGHHGASSRTAPMYFSIVSMVAGSRQLSGRCTMRDGMRKSSRSPSASSAAISAASAACWSSTLPSKCSWSERMPGTMSITPGSVSRLQLGHQRVDADAQLDVEHDRRHIRRGCCGRPAGDRRCAGACPAAGISARIGRQVGDVARGRWARRANRSSGAAAAVCRVLGADGHEAQPVVGRQLPDLPAIRRDHRERADEAAQRGPVGAEDDRHVAGKVDRADGIGIVVDVRRVQPGLAAVLARPFAAWGRRAARRCGCSCSGPATRPRRIRRYRPAVKKSGAPCGPYSTRSVQRASDFGQGQLCRFGRPVLPRRDAACRPPAAAAPHARRTGPARRCCGCPDRPRCPARPRTEYSRAPRRPLPGPWPASARPRHRSAPCRVRPARRRASRRNPRRSGRCGQAR